MIEVCGSPPQKRGKSDASPHLWIWLHRSYLRQHVQSHDANKIQSKSLKKARDIFKFVEDNTLVVGIDEAQFFDEAIIEVAQKLAFRKIRVIVAGLDLDFRGGLKELLDQLGLNPTGSS